MENVGEVKVVFTRFCQLSNAIKEAAEKTGKKLMEHPNDGFLCCCPLNLGTSLRGSAMIVLPELNKERAQARGDLRASTCSRAARRASAVLLLVTSGTYLKRQL
jgi:hypothetical protein